ncbi:MAG: alpha-mannosidase [Clostridiales bacterium]|nr:alpha-mannosidase [Clostridiales bacterium]
MHPMMMIGNAHLDPVWLWQWQEGYQEVKATFQSALDRLDETSDFVFTCACAGYYEWIEENDPAMFEQIKARVKEGRWAVVGGMWIQPDMNVPSGESLARQLLYSQRYFKEKLGITVNTGYNVDTFGHNAMTPQLLQKAGIENYVWMRPSIQENPDIPQGPMIWEAPDGSHVTAFRIAGGYGCIKNIQNRIDEHLDFAHQIGYPIMLFYGVGNHGGGPTIQVLKEIAAYQKDSARGEQVKLASPMDYFDLLKKGDFQLPIWKKELQHHASGCYSTHSASKQLHRKAENALLRAETLGSLAQKLTGHQLKKPFMAQAWKNLMFNEFHDIMGGCSLPEALDDALMQLQESRSIAAREENAALQRISWQVNTWKGLPRSKEEDWSLWGLKGQGTPVVVFNPHSFEAEGDVVLRRPIRMVRDDEGNAVAAQVIRASRTNHNDTQDSIFRAKVPALGYRLYWVYLEEEKEAIASSLSCSTTHLENDFIRAEFDPETGALCHLIHKPAGMDALLGPASAKAMDISHCDTWAHSIFKFDQETASFGQAEISLLEEGPVRVGLKVVTHLGASTLEQKYFLYASSDQLDVEVRLDSHEKHKMIKLCFPTAGEQEISEIPYGAIPRDGNGNEECCQRWFLREGERGGLAILNDGKYSYSAPEGELRLTIANTSIFADHYGQEQRDDSCRFMDQGEMCFAYALVPYAGKWQNARLYQRAALLNMPLPHVTETYHKGPLPACYCGIRGTDFVEMGALKRAENDDGYILRVHDALGQGGSAQIELPLLGRSLPLTFTPFEIKTIFLPDNAALPYQEMLLTEEGER